ncbi:hypothetical protein BY458DRAFT_503195 [Sporodiniella umbellata]|nr:hypothetical protein BY458DRAFT_503195 [Sporodiniella umbellata]
MREKKASYIWSMSMCACVYVCVCVSIIVSVAWSENIIHCKITLLIFAFVIGLAVIYSLSYFLFPLLICNPFFSL